MEAENRGGQGPKWAVAPLDGWMDCYHYYLAKLFLVTEFLANKKYFGEHVSITIERLKR
jgi:hypothetical protein